MVWSLLWVVSIIATIIIVDKKRLNFAGYFILSLILGPVGLLIAFLAAPKKEEISVNKSHSMSRQEAFDQLDFVKRSIVALQKRIGYLETALNVTQSAQVKHEEQTLEANVKQEIADNKEDGFELAFGKFWLSRIGVIVFILGIAFFISYTFQYFNALAKIMVGYIFSALFFWGGSFLEKIERYKKIAWGILGGSWGLLYLSTYALHYISSTRLINDPLIAVFLLMIVSILTVKHNLKYQSPVVSLMAYLPALITVGLGDVNFTTIVLWILLIGSMALIALRKKWHDFLFSGIIGSYTAFYLWVKPGLLFTPRIALSASVTLDQYLISFGILTVSWVLFSLSLCILKPDDEITMKHSVAGNIFNTGLYAVLGLNEIYRIGLQMDLLPDLRVWFLFLLAGLVFVLAWIFKILGRPRLIVVQCSLAFMLIALAVFIKFPNFSVGFFWIIQMMVMFLLGVYYKERVYRILAVLLGLIIFLRLVLVDSWSVKEYFILNQVVQHNILIFAFAIICFYALGGIFKKESITKILQDSEQALYFWGFPVISTFLLTLILGKETDDQWLSLAWAVEGAGILALGFWFGQKSYRICALAALVFACLRLFFIDMVGLNTIYRIIAFIALGVILLGVSLLYSKFLTKNKLNQEGP